MTPIRFVVYGECQPKGSARAFVRGGRAVVTTDNPNLHKWESSVRFAAETIVQKAGHRLMDGAVKVEIVFWLTRPKSVSARVRPFPTTRPDVDKAARAILDPLKSIVISDDAQVVALTATKLYTDGPAKAVVTISQVLHLTDLPTSVLPEIPEVHP